MSSAFPHSDLLDNLPSPPVQKPIPALGPSTSHSAILSKLRSSSPRSVLSCSSKTDTRDSWRRLNSSLSTDKSGENPSSMTAEVSMMADFEVERVSGTIIISFKHSYLSSLVNEQVPPYPCYLRVLYSFGTCWRSCGKSRNLQR